MLGRIPCSIFILITGYFYESIKKFNLTRIVERITPLFISTHIYALLLFLVSLIIGIPYTIYSIKNAFFPFFFSNGGYWFAATYLLLVIMQPYINLLINGIDKKEHFYLLILLFSVWSLFPTFFRVSYMFDNIMFMFIMYMTGAFIKRYGMKQKRKKRIYLILGISSIALMFISVIAFDLIGIYTGNKVWFGRATMFYSEDTVFSVVAAIALFIFFASLDIQKNYINFISKGVFGVYLIHNHILFHNIIWSRPDNSALCNIYIYALIKIIAVFFCCWIADYILRKFVIDPLTKPVCKIIELIIRKLLNSIIRIV